MLDARREVLEARREVDVRARELNECRKSLDAAKLRLRRAEEAFEEEGRLITPVRQVAGRVDGEAMVLEVLSKIKAAQASE